MALYRMFQELRSIFQDVIPEVIQNQKYYVYMGPIRNGFWVTTSSWEAQYFLDSQEIHRIVGNRKYPYCIDRRLPIYPIQKQ